LLIQGRKVNSLSIVLLLPPAPAARVLVGRALATLSALSAAAFLLIAVLGPPGGVGDDGRAVEDPTAWGLLTGEVARGEDWRGDQYACCSQIFYSGHQWQVLTIAFVAVYMQFIGLQMDRLNVVL
jgi:hypothetical protein